MKNIHILILAALILIVALAAFVIWGIPYFFYHDLPQGTMSTLGAGTVPARVVAIVEEGEIDLGGIRQQYQVMRVQVLEGEFKDIQLEVDYGRRQINSGNVVFGVNDKILVTIGARPDGMLTAYFVDFVRTTPLLWLLGTFVAAILLISRWKGLRSLIGMSFSLLVIIGYIIPHILQGEDPIRVSVIGAIILLSVTLYLAYGWNLKTHSAVVGMVIVLLITGTLAWFFVDLTRLTGTGDENALFLMQIQDFQINLRGLLLGGMLIGALGVLDDLVTTQASAVFELHAVNPKLNFTALYRSAMRIGQDHVVATVNTLLLAYAGASLPMLLVFTLGQGSFGNLINHSLIAEEIVRTLVGSLGLVSAVPITTMISSLLAIYGDRLGAIRPFLGPENSGHAGHHHH